MEKEELEEIRKMVANDSYTLSLPINFDEMIETGVLRKIGKSYYTDNLDLLPDLARKRLKNVSSGKHGLKVTFTKETKSMAKIAKSLEEFRD